MEVVLHGGLGREVVGGCFKGVCGTTLQGKHIN